MKVVQIHSGTLGSIGKIIADIAQTLASKEIECYAVVADCNGKKIYNYYCFSTPRIHKINRILGRVTGYNNCFAFFSTKGLIRRLEQIQPDVIHLHNLHDGYVNIKMLFRYLAKTNIPVVWTLHDCWSFTGKCPYFDIVECEKWKTGCYACPIYKQYPKAEFDRTKYLYSLKKKVFNSIENLTIVTPSYWLANCVEQSFLGNIPRRVIHNGINHSVFHPIESDLRKRYNLEGKEIILGVAAPFDKRKGVHIFERLAEELPTEEFALVMIGLSEEQVSQFSDKIVKIQRTSNQEELAAWYSAADVFLNPTLEEVLGMTNIEAIACGTPVITFATGGSPECLTERTGIVIERNNYKEILHCLQEKRYKRFDSDECIERSKFFTKENMTDSYAKLYEECVRS